MRTSAVSTHDRVFLLAVSGAMVLLLAVWLAGCSAGGVRSAATLRSAHPAAQAIGRADAVKRAAAQMKWVNYTVVSSALATVSPYGTAPRRVWKIVLRNLAGDSRFPAEVWVDVTSGESEFVATD